MKADFVFSLASKAVLPCWLLLIFLPRRRWTQRLATFAVPLLLAVTYGWLLATAERVPGAGFGTIGAVRALFTVDRALTAGWLHYLAFDLFIGGWEARDALRLGIARWMVAPCLVLTFLFGPIGLGCYLVLRAALRREFGVLAEEAGR